MFQFFIYYVFVQWVCYLIKSYSFKKELFELKQIQKMRQLSYVTLGIMIILGLLSLNDFFESQLLAVLIVPVFFGFALFCMFYSLLVFVTIFVEIFKLKHGQNSFIFLISLIVMPIGFFTLDLKEEYNKNTSN